MFKEPIEKPHSDPRLDISKPNSIISKFSILSSQTPSLCWSFCHVHATSPVRGHLLNLTTSTALQEQLEITEVAFCHVSLISYLCFVF